jgi:hypothetical protein
MERLDGFCALLPRRMRGQNLVSTQLLEQSGSGISPIRRSLLRFAPADRQLGGPGHRAGFPGLIVARSTQGR